MSIFGFYTEVNFGCVSVLMLLFYSIKKLPTPLLKYPLFQKLILWHIIYFISDSMWAFVNDGVLPKNTFSVLLVNYSNVVILPVVAYSCFLFAEISTRPDMTRKQIEHLQVKLLIPIIAQALILLVSFIVAPDFWLNDKLEPCDLYYMLLAIMPMLYWITATIRGVIRAREVQNQPNFRTYLIVASYTPGVLIAGGAQVFFALTTPLFCFWCTFIILFVYLHLQNQLISTDSLTMLNNRNRLHDFLLQQREEKDSFVIMVDVDHFKQINDTYGHAEGDRALVLVSQALKKACEQLSYSMFLCRYGGDEFLMIAQTDVPDEVVKKIKDCLQEEVEKENGSRSYTIEASMGFARWDGRPDSFKESMVNADKKMYEDKRLA
ncbi:GGDEF domain-containing protein [Fibrobacter succinogenes]|uniref:GGDEF domain-containing protein n=1 Tax=Fibrobacter succinogenes TaxID=833 RepID=UPI0026F34C78|nr:GGDEF domain-containing protein [Fibrobacter succinogenes]